MSSWARVGAKVVCVNAIYDLVKGETYTISQVMHPDSSGNIGIVLEETLAPITWQNEVGAFRLSRFRPLQTISKADDVAMFKDIAADTPFHLMVEEGLINLDAFKLDTTPSTP